MTRIAVLASGRGSNFRALVEAERAGAFPGRIVLLLSDRQDAGAFAIAEEFEIPARHISEGKRRARLGLETEALYLDACRAACVEWICLAGFMRIIGGALLDGFPDRVLNIHPSLLPSFPGLEAQRQAWVHGAKVSGCTVHLVDRGVDTGPIVLQKSVPVLADDEPGDLAARILAEEHKLYPLALRLLLSDPWRREGRRLIYSRAEKDE
jgi:phosphoribosylglycinamide formyltransferase-1